LLRPICKLRKTGPLNLKLFETFHPDADLDKLETVLVESGIPRIPAIDIIRSATRFFNKHHDLARKPLAIFWDAENVRIPSAMSARVAHERIRKTLSYFGVPRDFFLYQDPYSGVGKQTRLELHACGWQAMDTPHIGNGQNIKEVADKMIIVDSLLYCMNHQSTGATLCFITSDQDFSYLLNKLRNFPQIRTLVVHNAGENVKSCELLRSAANVCLSWDDVLQYKSERAMTVQTVASPAPVKAEAVVRTVEACAVKPEAASALLKKEDSSIGTSDNDLDSMAFLLDVLQEEEEYPGAIVLRSVVGSRMHQKNPIRFQGGKSKVGKLLKLAAERGDVKLGGDGGRDWCRRVLK
jgi:hypothetical protein